MVDVPLATAPDGVVAGAWAAACAAVRAYCGWHVAPNTDEDVILDGSGSSLMMLPTLHLTGLADVVDDGTTVLDPEWSVTGIVRKPGGGYWSWKFRSFAATMTHGYDECPAEILAVLEEAAARGVGGVSASQVGQVRYETTGDAPRFMLDQKAVLDRYRIPNLR